MTDEWGPPVWKWMHAMAAARDNTMQDDDEFWRQVGRWLPCETCVEHFEVLERQYPCSRAASASEWVVEIHNRVNALLSKPRLIQPRIQLILPWSVVFQAFSYLLLSAPLAEHTNDWVQQCFAMFPFVIEFETEEQQQEWADRAQLFLVVDPVQGNFFTGTTRDWLDRCFKML